MQLAAIEFSQGIEDAWSDVASFIPKLVAFLLILIIGFVIVKAISKIADAALERFGFDKAVERGGIKKALENSKYDASDVVGQVIFYGLFLIVLQMAFGVFGQNPVSDLIAGVISYLPKVVAAILILVIGAAIAAAAKDLLEAALGNMDSGKTVANVVSIAILVTVGFAALNQLQIAPAIVNGLFYAALAIIVGSTVIAVGGGGIKPMQQRWESSLNRYDSEKAKAQNQPGTPADRMKDQAQDRMAQAKTATPPSN
ncbi:MAG: helix repeat-containing protein [Ilumatobacteraceae bacterium]|nr:helix repeat-containing protein [Ilumatobacteraceae bacterium]